VTVVFTHCGAFDVVTTGMIFTPICPHTLSFRPIVLPETCELTLRMPEGARGSCTAAFDGRRRTELQVTDFIMVCVGGRVFNFVFVPPTVRVCVDLVNKNSIHFLFV